MNDIIRHRGPDDEGFSIFDINSKELVLLGGADTPENCYESNLSYAPKSTIDQYSETGAPAVALGHRRLSILDLSPNAHQPMKNQDNRFVIVYNGEVYNFKEIKKELIKEGSEFISTGDTEVILEAYKRWGVSCLNKFNGMFSIIIIDRNTNTFFAARDRFGIKPLYYWKSNSGFLAFGSEIKQFTVLDGWQARFNPQRVYDNTNWGIIDHTDETTFAGVNQLKGGHYLLFSLTNKAPDLHPVRWYSPKTEPLDLSFDESCKEFHDLLEDSVRLRLRADVEVGSCLSGGIDSSTIVCLMANQLAKVSKSGIQNTFSATSHIPQFDESKYIDIVHQRYNFKLHSVVPSAESLLSELDALTWSQDEAYHSSSLFAQRSVFKLSSQANIKVTLDGQGADEILAGYHGYFGPLLASHVKNGRFISTLSEMKAMKDIHGYNYGVALQRMADNLLPFFMRQSLRQLAGKSSAAPTWLSDDFLSKINLNDPYETNGQKGGSIYNYSLAQTFSTHLPGLLHWADRNSMANSIESRVPFLDYRVVEFCLRSPDNFKLKNGITKRILRESMKNILPRQIYERQDKMGFVTAEQVWVQDEMKDVFKTKIRESVEKSNGLLTSEVISIADDMLEKRVPYDNKFWSWLTLGQWVDKFKVSQ